MRARGRPKHPGILTPREQEVFRLLRQGLTNPQIAERLGISLDGAKYHVAEILSKLGVESREEAARVRLETYRPWWLKGFTPFAALWRRLSATPSLPAIASVSSGVILAAALGGLAFLGVLLFRSSEAPGFEPIEGTKAMPVSEAQARLLSALSGEGEVLHVTYRDERADGTVLNGETWIDVEQDLARAHGPDPPERPEPVVRILRDGSWWALDERSKLTQAPLGVGVQVGGKEKSSLLALDYVWTFILYESTEARVVNAELNGAQVTVIEVEQRYDADGYDGTRQARLYLDESFLPVRQDYREQSVGPAFAETTYYEHAFASPSSLAEDFFSIEPLRTKEITPIERMVAYAEENDLALYWLGETFEGMTLHEVAEQLYYDRIPVLELTYKRGGGGPNDPPPADEPPSGIRIAEFTPDAWRDWTARPGGRSWFLYAGEAETITETGDLRVTVYVDPYAGHRGVEAPPGEPTPTAPHPDWLARVAVVKTPEAVLFIEPNMGPTPSNDYRRDGEALARLAQALRPLGDPAEPRPGRASDG